MHVLLTGATGTVGRFVAAALAARGDRVTTLGRTGAIRWQLGEAPALPAADALVHCAFHHLPGRFRGGEGDDPAGFQLVNVEGARRLLKAAAEAGVPRAIGLSSRAVYGDGRSGPLDEADLPAPDTLYGEVKLALEAALRDYPGTGISIRPTGVCGMPPGSDEHKWRGLFAGWLRGEAVLPRVATEVHGADLADAILRLLDAPGDVVRGRAYNVSDLVLDRRDLLRALGRAAGLDRPLPPAADRDRLGVMRTAALEALGWRAGGWPRLEAELSAMAALARRDAGLA